MRYRRKHKGKLLISILLIAILGYSVFANIEINLSNSPLSVLQNLIDIYSTADTDYGWNLILVNRDYYIPKDYIVELTELSNGKKVDFRIYPGLQGMFDDARAEGFQLFVADGYRTEEMQLGPRALRISSGKCDQPAHAEDWRRSDRNGGWEWVSCEL